MVDGMVLVKEGLGGFSGAKKWSVMPTYWRDLHQTADVRSHHRDGAGPTASRAVSNGLASFSEGGATWSWDWEDNLTMGMPSTVGITLEVDMVVAVCGFAVEQTKEKPRGSMGS
jgi:hypothetical protein